MTNRISLALIVLAANCLMLSSISRADTSVWKISKNNHHLYLGGTVHILAEADYPLPPSYEKAYQLSHRVVFETDMQKLKSPDFLQIMLQKLTYNNGKTLGNILSVQTYQKLKDYCESRGIALASIDKFKPGMLTTVLLLFELQRLGLAGVGVDEFFNSKAHEDAKPVGELETAEAQIEFLAEMGRGEEDELIEYSLSEMDDLSNLMSTTKQAWRSGDMKALTRVAIDPYIDKFPHTFDNLLNLRNRNWMPKIEAMLLSAEVEFVLVGVLHLSGEQGLLAQLKSRGYTIEQH